MVVGVLWVVVVVGMTWVMGGAVGDRGAVVVAQVMGVLWVWYGPGWWWGVLCVWHRCCG